MAESDPESRPRGAVAGSSPPPSDWRRSRQVAQLQLFTEFAPAAPAPPVMPLPCRALFVGLLATSTLTACITTSPPETPEVPAITEAEVAVFMQEYAADLRARNGDKIAARYDSAGAYLLGNGNKMFVPKDSIAAFYRAVWKGPAFFEWSNLSYEPAGPAAMVVAGQFRWVDVGGKDTVRFSYTSLVRKTPAGLRIRLEDESFAPPTPPARP